jgi:hypothetical protein
MRTVPETLLAPVPACLIESALVQINHVPTAQPKTEMWLFAQLFSYTQTSMLEWQGLQICGWLLQN